LRGNDVRRVNFYNIIPEVSLFHISTHGCDKDISIGNNDLNSMKKEFLADNARDVFSFALSGYNTDRRNCSISAASIRKIDYTNLKLVYLDACTTSRVTTSYYGSHSMAKAFYCSGAHDVIAYTSSVLETIASDFSHLFYNTIQSTPSISIHDAFYQTKQTIYHKYKSSLEKSDLGEPCLGIVLWE